jgi:hypothetical protein
VKQDNDLLKTWAPILGQPKGLGLGVRRQDKWVRSWVGVGGEELEELGGQ